MCHYLRTRWRIPSTREFAKQHGFSRGTVVTVFEQLKSEGYLRTGKGAGTWINPHLAIRKTAPARVLQTNARYPPDPLVGLQFSYPPRPFGSMCRRLISSRFANGHGLLLDGFVEIQGSCCAAGIDAGSNRCAPRLQATWEHPAASLAPRTRFLWYRVFSKGST